MSVVTLLTKARFPTLVMRSSGSSTRRGPAKRRSSEASVASALLTYGRKLGAYVRPTTTRRRLSGSVANTFILGVLLDRSVTAAWAWQAAEHIESLLGNPTSPATMWVRLARMERHRLTGFLRYGYGGKAFHRHYKTYARQLPMAAAHVLEHYEGDPRRLWNNTRDVVKVRDRMDALPGVGMALARMAVLMLARDYGVLGGHAALPHLDVKPDIHVMRVFRRCGLIGRRGTRNEAVAIAQTLHPRYPGAFDAPAFNIGRTWCRPTKPNCAECPLTSACPRAGLTTRTRAS